MSSLFSFSCYLCFLVVLGLSHSCISIQKAGSDVLCMKGERQALLQFKHGLIDKTGRLASWVGTNRNCCRWTGIVCDNITGHVHEIHLQGNSPFDNDFDPTRQLGGHLSSSLLRLKQLRHLDLSCNNFGGIQVPKFIGSFRNLRYLNLSVSGFSGTIPHQLANLTRLQVLSLESYVSYVEDTTMMNMQWLSSLRLLQHLDLSGVDLTEATNWFQVINTLPSLTELHLSGCYLMDIHPHVPSLNITFLSKLDLSYNYFDTYVPQWILSITNLVLLDLSACNFHSLIHGNIDSFRNLTSLKLLHVSGNDFMNSSLVLKGLSSTVASNLVSLKIGYCGVSSSLLNSFHNLTSLLSLDLSQNKLTKKLPKSFVNICNLRDIDLSSNDFSTISLNHLLGGFLECEPHIGRSSPLEELYVSNISGTIPDVIGQLTSIKRLSLHGNRISGSIPHSIGRLSSLEELDLSENRLNGSLPDSLGNLSKLEGLRFSNNLLTGVVTEAQFAKLASLKYLVGFGNNLTLRPRLADWIPPFRLSYLDLSSWSLGPQFPLWLKSQTHLTTLYIRNTSISSAIPVSFWKSFSNLTYLDMSYNHIQGTLLDIPATVTQLALNFNEFRGELPELSNGSLLQMLDLSNNLFEGSLHRFLCSNSVKKYPDPVFRTILHLGNNNFSGVIPECWDKWQELVYLNLENNSFSGEIPRTLGSLHQLQRLHMRGNKLSGRLPNSLMNLKDLMILQIGVNELVGRIPKWFGNLSSLRLLNLRSNKFVGNIPDELCYPTHIQILDLAHNNLSGNIPRCFKNYSIFSGKEDCYEDLFIFQSDSFKVFGTSDSLVIKGREDTYNTILGQVILLDLSSNNLVGHIPSELMTLLAMRFLNLSGNQLTGRIPENIGVMKLLESLDLSLNKLSGKLPMSLSNLTYLDCFNVSWNHLTGSIPKGTQLQSFQESSFFGNQLCGDPLPDCISTEISNAEVQKEDNASHGEDCGLIISILLGLVVGFCLIMAPLMVSRAWRIAYFCFLSEQGYMVYDVMRKYGVSMFLNDQKCTRDCLVCF